MASRIIAPTGRPAARPSQRGPSFKEPEAELDEEALCMVMHMVLITGSSGNDADTR